MLFDVCGLYCGEEERKENKYNLKYLYRTSTSTEHGAIE